MTSVSTATSYPSTHAVVAAAAAVAQALKDSDVKYAVVGGAACLLLGSHRVTADVDFVVPTGRMRDSRLLLKAQTALFAVDSRTNNTRYLGEPPVDIQMLAPPGLFREPFDVSTPTIEISGIQILKPTSILNSKCRAIVDRTGQGKKTTDAHDIKFLLHWCAENVVYPSALQVPNATKELVDAFVVTYGGKELWTQIGYDMVAGKHLFPTPHSLISFRRRLHVAHRLQAHGSEGEAITSCYLSH